MVDSETINGRFICVLILAVLVIGCAVGPDFKRPGGETTDVTGSTTNPLPGRTVATSTALGESQRFVEGGRVNPQWWQEFGSA